MGLLMGYLPLHIAFEAGIFCGSKLQKQMHLLQ